MGHSGEGDQWLAFAPQLMADGSKVLQPVPGVELKWVEDPMNRGRFFSSTLMSPHPKSLGFLTPFRTDMASTVLSSTSLVRTQSCSLPVAQIPSPSKMELIIPVPPYQGLDNLNNAASN